MLRAKLLSSSVVAVFVLGVVASASAATTDLCPATAGTPLPALCIEKATNDLVAETGSFPFVSVIEAGVESLLEVPELGMHIVCSVTNGTGSFEQTVLETTVLAMGVVFAFSSCELLEIEGLKKKCKVTEPVTTLSLDGSFPTVDTELRDVTFAPETGTQIATVELQNNGTEKCPALLAGAHTLTGGVQLCWLLEAESDLQAHVLECPEEGSDLLLIEDPLNAKLSEEIILSGANSDLPWSIESGAASSATADLCPETVGTLLPALCIEKATGELSAETGSFPFVSVIEAGVEWLLEIPELGVHLVCTAVSDAGNFEQTVLATTVLAMQLLMSFSTCELLEVEGLRKKCKVEEPITTADLDGSIPNVDTELLDVTLTPESGTIFVTFTFVNNGTETCPALLRGAHPLAGSQLCWLLTAEKDELARLLECVEEGSDFLWFEDSTNFKLTEEVILGGANSDLPWSIQLA